jgi:hypothetical protein
MRSLGIALCVAWMSVGLNLLWFPPRQLQSEILLSSDFIESMQTSPLKDTPEMHQGIEQAKRLLKNPSRRATVIWIAWTALLFLVVYGLWTAYAVFRNQSFAFGYVLIGCLLFLGRQVIFHRAAYEMLFDGIDKFRQILNAGYYENAFSIIWHHYVLGIFFFSLTILSLFRLARMIGGDQYGQTFVA